MIGDRVEDRHLRAALAERIHPSARSRLAVCRRAGLEVIEARLPGPFRALFTTRRGGASARPFASLNVSERSEDDPVLVAQNRARVAAALAESSLGSGREGVAAKLPGYRLISPNQTHGVRVTGISEYADLRDDGDPADSCDGLILNPSLDQGLAALLVFADCVPIVLVGEADVAVVHGGWRGILGGIIGQAACAMTGPPGMAIIGPSLGPCCFTVGEEVAGAFRQRFGPDVAAEGRVDLWAAVESALGELGIADGQIINPRLCTACNRDLFYSYRAEGPVTGRHACVVWTVAA